MESRHRNKLLSDAAAHLARARALVLDGALAARDLDDELLAIAEHIGELSRRAESIARGRDLEIKDEGDFLTLRAVTEIGRRFMARHAALALRHEGLFANNALGWIPSDGDSSRAIIDADARRRVLTMIGNDQPIPRPRTTPERRAVCQEV